VLRELHTSLWSRSLKLARCFLSATFCATSRSSSSSTSKILELRRVSAPALADTTLLDGVKNGS